MVNMERKLNEFREAIREYCGELLELTTDQKKSFVCEAVRLALVSKTKNVGDIASADPYHCYMPELLYEDKQTKNKMEICTHYVFNPSSFIAGVSGGDNIVGPVIEITITRPFTIRTPASKHNIVGNHEEVVMIRLDSIEEVDAVLSLILLGEEQESDGFDTMMDAIRKARREANKSG